MRQPLNAMKNECMIVDGEQVPMRRTMLTADIRIWKDFYDGRRVQLATFIQPDKCSVNVLRDTQYIR